jgi:uncharacterized protein YndB with AHSA1/START domain
MTERSEAHGSFTITRRYKQAPARVWSAYADPVKKSRWFGADEGWTTLEEKFDFRTGGRERQKGRWTDGTVSDFEALYFDIVPNERMVFAYEMHIDEKKISVSLTTITLEADGAGTKLTHTEHGVFLDGFDDNGGREEGTRQLMEALEKVLAEA